jgi:F0F1-type ATP synthase epsilon subunit
MAPIKVKILDTKSIVFEGEVDRITSINEVGPFDIYPTHANFISIIKKKLTLYRKNKIFKEIKFAQAVLKVKRDLVNVYLGIEELILDDEIFLKRK